MEASYTFIIIDDDAVNNFICREFIGLSVKNPKEIVDFTNPQEGLNFIAQEYSKPGRTDPATLFLDINMPSMSGWEFLEKFGELDEHVRKLIHIYILSSSVDPRDRSKALQNTNVCDMITKPVSEEFLAATFPDLTPGGNAY